MSAQDDKEVEYFDPMEMDRWYEPGSYSACWNKPGNPCREYRERNRTVPKAEKQVKRRYHGAVPLNDLIREMFYDGRPLADICEEACISEATVLRRLMNMGVCNGLRVTPLKWVMDFARVGMPEDEIISTTGFHPDFVRFGIREVSAQSKWIVTLPEAKEYRNKRIAELLVQGMKPLDVKRSLYTSALTVHNVLERLRRSGQIGDYSPECSE